MLPPPLDVSICKTPPHPQLTAPRLLSPLKSVFPPCASRQKCPGLHPHMHAKSYHSLEELNNIFILEPSLSPDHGKPSSNHLTHGYLFLYAIARKRNSVTPRLSHTPVPWSCLGCHLQTHLSSLPLPSCPLFRVQSVFAKLKSDLTSFPALVLIGLCYLENNVLFVPKTPSWSDPVYCSDTSPCRFLELPSPAFLSHW